MIILLLLPFAAPIDIDYEVTPNYYEYNSEETIESPLNISSHPIECGEAEQEKVKQCAEPLYEIGALSGASNYIGWEGVLFKTKEYFAEVCDNLFLFNSCIEPYKDVCFSADKARSNYDAAIRILDFLCRDGYGEIMRNFECFTKTLTRSEMMQCQAELVSDTNRISETHSHQDPEAKQAVCGAMKNYVDCVKYPIRYECGYRAWNLVKEIITRPAQTVLPECRLNSSNSFFRYFFVLVIFFNLFT